MGKKGKEAKRREKKQRTGKKHLSLKPQDYYEVSGDSVTRKRKNCPRCGPGTWLADHKGRLYCGKCGYTEFDRKPEPGSPAEAARPPEQKPPETGPEAPKEPAGEAEKPAKEPKEDAQKGTPQPPKEDN